MRTFDLHQPHSTDEAVALLAQHGDEAQVVAGGAMLAILLRQRLIAPQHLISVTDIPSLQGMEATAAGVRFGATTTLRTIERSPEIQQRYPVLREALGLVANVRVRNVATIGGHLAHADPHLDLPPVLMALNATVGIQGPAGERSLPLAELFTGYYETALEPDEIITWVSIPPQVAGWQGAYLKYCSLTPTDWPTVGVAAFLRIEDGLVAEARVIAGSVAERPLEVAEAEALLQGERLTRAAVAEAARRYAEAAEPLSDMRGSSDYKRKVTEVYVRRALAQAAERAGLEIE
jgi:aerobic carbon-monoxide dehydrogenase medium subunit